MHASSLATAVLSGSATSVDTNALASHSSRPMGRAKDREGTRQHLLRLLVCVTMLYALYALLSGSWRTCSVASTWSGSSEASTLSRSLALPWSPRAAADRYMCLLLCDQLGMHERQCDGRVRVASSLETNLRAVLLQKRTVEQLIV